MIDNVALRARHGPLPGSTGDDASICWRCQTVMPCDATILLNENEWLRKVRNAAKAVNRTDATPYDWDWLDAMLFATEES